MKMELLQSIIAPLRALLAGQRAAAASAFSILRSRLRPTRRGYEAPPVLFSVPLPRPSAQSFTLSVPAAALMPPSTLGLTRARCQWSWAADQTVSRGGARPAALAGRLVSPNPLRRRRERGAVFDVALTLRSLDPTEGMQRLQQAVGRAKQDGAEGRP